MDNRREARRFRALRGGKLIFNGGNSVLDCVVRDISETGAKIQVATSIGIPERFALMLEGEKTTRPRRIVRRTAGELGVVFE